MAFNRISFEMNNICNLQCAHCLREEIWTRTDNVHLSPALVDKVLKEAKTLYGTEKVVFTGGEVTLSPKLPEIIDICCDYGMTWGVVTNGIRKEPIAKLINDPRRRKHLSVIAISIDGATAETHEKIRGEGTYRKTMRTIAYLHGKEVPICIKTTINKKNVHEVEELAMMGARLGVSMMKYSPLHLTPDGFDNDLVLPPDEWPRIYDRIGNIHKILNVPYLLSAGGKDKSSMVDCEAFNLGDIHVDYRGHMSLCCVLPAYRGQGDGQEKDLVADLNTESLADGHARLLDLLHGYNNHRIERLKDNTVHELDKFLCFSCEKYMGKMGWLADPKYADSPWVENMKLPESSDEPQIKLSVKKTA